MFRILLIFIFFGLFTSGCEESGRRRSHYDEVMGEIEELKRGNAGESLGNIRVEVKMLSTSESEYAGVNVLWRYVDENVVIANRSNLVQSGVRIGTADENFESRVEAVWERLRQSESVEMFLVLQPGYPGYISVGKEIAVSRFYYLGRWYSYVDYEFQEARKGFEVAARLTGGGMIELELLPVFSNFTGEGGDLRLTELATKVVVEPGKAVVIGSYTGGSENAGAALLSYQKENTRMRILITTRAYLQ
jgi:hypothetical protein